MRLMRGKILLYCMLLILTSVRMAVPYKHVIRGDFKIQFSRKNNQIKKYIKKKKMENKIEQKRYK
jgi:hypothetical protein